MRYGDPWYERAAVAVVGTLLEVGAAVAAVAKAAWARWWGRVLLILGVVALVAGLTALAVWAPAAGMGNALYQAGRLLLGPGEPPLRVMAVGLLIYVCAPFVVLAIMWLLFGGESGEKASARR